MTAKTRFSFDFFFNIYYFYLFIYLQKIITNTCSFNYSKLFSFSQRAENNKKKKTEFVKERSEIKRKKTET